VTSARGRAGSRQSVGVADPAARSSGYLRAEGCDGDEQLHSARIQRGRQPTGTGADPVNKNCRHVEIICENYLDQWLGDGDYLVAPGGSAVSSFAKRVIDDAHAQAPPISRRRCDTSPSTAPRASSRACLRQGGGPRVRPRSRAGSPLSTWTSLSSGALSWAQRTASYR
jgi:hypothetical protein